MKQSIWTRPLSIKAALQTWLGLSLQNPAGWPVSNASFTGKSVTVDGALKLATVWACVRLISETLATLPLGFYKREKDGSRTPATTHNLYELLHNQPNADMTAVMFWEAVVASMLLWGNAYIEIVRSGNTVVALRFLHPWSMNIRKTKTGAREYVYREDMNKPERVISEANMMHVPAFSLDGVTGLSPVSYGANVFGTSIETDKASAETFRDAMRAPAVLTVNKVLTNPQREQIRAHVKQVSADGGVYVLEAGTGFQTLKFNPVDAELLSSREWNVSEICRWFGLDPVMVGHGSKDSNWGTGLEQKMLWFLIFALRKWCVRLEQAVRKNLLTPVERKTYFAEFAMEGLLRGDSAARSAWYEKMVRNGIFTRDFCRALENQAPMGGNAAVLTIESNMVALDALAEKAEPSTTARNALMAWLAVENKESA